MPSVCAPLAWAMVAMIGLGVGIDYALFIVTRYREGLRLGLRVEESVVEAMDTSGRAVMFAGVTVIISLMGLTLIGLNFVQGVAIASSVGVLLMILGSLTLLPALLGWVGTRIDNTSRAALIAVGIAGIFMETHPDPDKALSDGPNAWPLPKMRALLETLLAIDTVTKRNGFLESTS